MMIALAQYLRNACPCLCLKQDIKPTHSKHARARDAAAGGGGEEDDGDDDDDELRVWNLRKCSAAALDMLSNHLGDEHVLPLLLPIVQQRLADQDWKVRNADDTGTAEAVGF